MPTKINWTDEVLNPIVGCSKISPGCANCYAAEAAKSARLQQFPQYQTVKDWDGTIAFVESQLIKPLQWKKPKKIFVCSMSDLFHENVTDEMRDKIFAVIALCPQHTFQVLTKRPEKAASYFAKKGRARMIAEVADQIAIIKMIDAQHHIENIPYRLQPLSNVWVGVTVENQAMADHRIPLLLQIPAAKRWLSMEPLLDEVDITSLAIPNEYAGFQTEDDNPNEFIEYISPLDPNIDGNRIDWVVVGGESGANARPCQRQWIESIVNQCKESGVPVWVKQLGSNSHEMRICKNPDGTFTRTEQDGGRIPLPNGDRAWSKLENLPTHLQIREFPHD